MRRNSLLVSLFRPSIDPADPNSLETLIELQNRSQLNSLLQQQFNGSTEALEKLNQNLQQGQSVLRELKNKLNKLTMNSSQEIPAVGFKPNSQRTKSFLKRLELGTNIQTQKSSSYFP